MKRILACGLLVLALPASAAPQSWMVGRWFGSGQPNDKSQMWVADAAPDGRFHVLHRQCIQGKAFDATNDGTWELKGDLATMRIEKVDGQAMPSARVDVYRVLSHNETRQTYRYEATGFVYNSRKVDGKFQMPPCDLAS